MSRCAMLGFVCGAVWLQQQAVLPPYPACGLAAVCVAASVLVPALRRWHGRAGRRARLALAMAAGGAAGFFWSALLAHHALAPALPKSDEGRDIVLTGVVDSLPSRMAQGMRFNLAVEHVHDAAARVPPRIALSWFADSRDGGADGVPDIRPGQRWRLAVRLQRPHGNANPYGFDYELWLLEQGVRATGYVRQQGTNRLLAGFVPGLGPAVERARAALRDRIVQALPRCDYAGVIVALVIGDQRAISQSDWDIFNRTGISHLVSISGLHITMIAGLAAWAAAAVWRRSFFTRAQLPLLLPVQKAAAVAGVLTALAYVLLAGFGVPAQRTLYMLAVVAAALWLDRLAGFTHILCLAACVTVVLDPWAVMWPGFWLSFGAVAAILYATAGRSGNGFGDRVLGAMDMQLTNKWFSSAKAAASAGGGADIGAGMSDQRRQPGHPGQEGEPVPAIQAHQPNQPIQPNPAKQQELSNQGDHSEKSGPGPGAGAAAGQRWPVRGWLAGMAAGLVLAARVQYAVTVGLVPLTLLLFAQFSLASPVANALAIPVISLLVTPLALAGSLLPQAIGTPLLQLAHGAVWLLAQALQWISAWPHAVWTAPAPPAWAFAWALTGTAWMLAPRGWPVRWLGAVTWLPLMLAQPDHPPPGQFRVVAFDVGQGMALLVETAGHRLLYDTGPAYAPESNGGNRVILPYLKARGIGRLDGVIVSHSDTDHAGGALAVMQGIDAGWLASSLPVHHPVVRAASRHRHCVAGQHWRWDGVEFTVLHPTADSYGDPALKPNARSCVLKISANGRAVLLAGDIEAAQEAQLLARGAGALRADVLLAPHHGSGTSSTQAFLRAVAPSVALFQVGYRNRYRHPQPQVWARYGALDIGRLRTDETGAITVEMASSVLMESYRASHARYWYGR